MSGGRPTIAAHGRGLLAHHFHAPYWAAIAIAFETREQAAGALEVLGAPWWPTKGGKAIVANVAGDELDELKRVLARYGADPRKIDSCARSIDYGEAFTVVMVVPGPRPLECNCGESGPSECEEHGPRE